MDSNENAFKMAASMGFREACRKANPVILEPMMAVEAETPEDYAGSVMGDLSSRRGMVQGMDDMVGGGKIIKAEVPCPRCSATRRPCARCRKGRATYTMEFKHYSEVRRTCKTRSSPLAPSDWSGWPGWALWRIVFQSSCPKASRRDTQRIEKR